MSKAIYWFRNNQRLSDNPSLHWAASRFDLLPVFILPPETDHRYQMGWSRYGDHRRQFLLESIRNLREDLRRAGGDLLILQGSPVDVLTDLADTTGIDTLVLSKELDFLERQQEDELKATFKIEGTYDQLLIRPQDLSFPPLSVPFGFSSFRKKVEKNISVREVLPAPQLSFVSHDVKGLLLEWEEIALHSDSAHPFHGGGYHAWERLKKYVWKTHKISNYKFTRNGLLGSDYSSKFSGFLAVGNLSPVEIYWEIKKYEETGKANVSTYWLVFELLWREFFKYTSWKFGSSFFLRPGILGEDREYPGSMRQFEKWCAGRTGVPFVDANMKELNATGFMSNRGRQNVASYLVHDLKVDWRKGADYFEQYLVDYDCSSNWGNWMYVAGVGNDRRNKKFDIEWQQQKYDSKGRFVALWNQ